ncbi:MAG: amino acid racemase [Acidobacteria bacterium]|nr:amino acid racemase [Acidobacteriota bacterium]
MSTRVGILGGISAESTVRYYDRIIKGYFERRRDYHYPEVVIFSLDFQRFTDFEDRGDRGGYVAEIMSGVAALERAGVEFIVMAANSPHAVFDEIEKLAKVPLLSIVKVTAEHAAGKGLRKLLLLGIKFTMQSSFYQEAARERGIEIVVPAGEDQDRINRIIFEELARGVVRDESREELLGIIKRYPADGAILGCTELPLILRQEDSPVPLLDTLELHAGAALDFALSS